MYIKIDISGTGKDITEKHKDAIFMLFNVKKKCTIPQTSKLDCNLPDGSGVSMCPRFVIKSMKLRFGPIVGRNWIFSVFLRSHSKGVYKGSGKVLAGRKSKRQGCSQNTLVFLRQGFGGFCHGAEPDLPGNSYTISLTVSTNLSTSSGASKLYSKP